MITKYVDLYVFFISFIIGLVFIYIMGSEKKEIVIYPTPDTYDDTIYKDKTGQCFKYKPVAKECPLNPLHVLAQK